MSLETEKPTSERLNSGNPSYMKYYKRITTRLLICLILQTKLLVQFSGDTRYVDIENREKEFGNCVRRIGESPRVWPLANHYYSGGPASRFLRPVWHEAKPRRRRRRRRWCHKPLIYANCSNKNKLPRIFWGREGPRFPTSRRDYYPFFFRLIN